MHIRDLYHFSGIQITILLLQLLQLLLLKTNLILDNAVLVFFTLYTFLYKLNVSQFICVMLCFYLKFQSLLVHA